LTVSLAACGGGTGTEPTRPGSDDYVRRSAFEGYGNATPGGEGGEVFHVTTLADGGPGSLREGVSERTSRPRRIVFDVAGTILLSADLIVMAPFLTVEGGSAPSPGVTIRQRRLQDEFVVGGTHDVIITDLRFDGLYVEGGPISNDASTINLDADRPPDRQARRIVLDHLTVRGSTDSGPDVWGELGDVTVSWCLFYESLHPMTVSGPGTRRRISMHHNVFARNGERNPQLREGVNDFDYVNNVVYDWGFYASELSGYGVRVRSESGEAPIHGNFVSNAFLPRSGFRGWALVYGDNPGADPDEGPRPEPPPAQGTVVTTSRMGRLWVSGNLLPAENRDHYSTVPAPLPVPAAARVTTFPVGELAARVLPAVGMRYRNAREQALIDELAAGLAGAAARARSGTHP
jgi:pectate lyase